MHELGDVAAQRCDFPDQGRGNERIALRRREEQAFDLWRQLPIHVRQLEFVFEVGHCPQPTQEDVGALFLGKMRKQGGEADDFDIGQVPGDLTGQRYPLFQREQRVFLRAGCHCDDHVVEQPRGALDQVAMAFGNGVESTRVQHSVHRVILAGVRWGVGW
ncbi:hypothetical protein D3C78_376560 [compost metagenome]